MFELTLHPCAHTQEPPSGLTRWPAWLAVHAGCSGGPSWELGQVHGQGSCPQGPPLTREGEEDRAAFS